MGVPSITTNVSGFGSYMEDLIETNQAKDYGIYIVDRRFKAPDESVEQLVDYMEEFVKRQEGKELIKEIELKDCPTYWTGKEWVSNTSRQGS